MREAGGDSWRRCGSRVRHRRSTEGGRHTYRRAADEEGDGLVRTETEAEDALSIGALVFEPGQQPVQSSRSWRDTGTDEVTEGHCLPTPECPL